MRRVTLYSSSGRAATASTGSQPGSTAGPVQPRDATGATPATEAQVPRSASTQALRSARGKVAPPADAPSVVAPPRPPRRWPASRAWFARRERLLLPVLGALGVAAGVALHAALVPSPRVPTQKDIDAAVLHTLDTKPLPSFATRAVEAVRPSVVRVRRLGAVAGSPGLQAPAGPKEPSSPQAPPAAQNRSARPDASGNPPGSPAAPGAPDAVPGTGAPRSPGTSSVSDKPSLTEIGVGTGVVILDTGVILTNLHVVEGADRLGVVFADGSESEAVVVSVQPENDLAVIRARTIPDDLVAATLRSTQNLAPGDAVAAVGYPFGIGPSASAGVVSGLRRDYVSPAGQRILSNLIQFDAAVNPGNSGGPLVTADGEVVGIVTGLLNPTDQQVFIGIGFAVPIENAAAAVGMSPF